MKKWVLGVLFATLLAGAAYAAVSVQDDGTDKGLAEKINFVGADTTRSGKTATVDMSALAGVNWEAVTGIRSESINWTDIRTDMVGVSGVNWEFLPTNGAGINWTTVSNNASANNLVCWKSNGQLGKCVTGVSGAACSGGCN